MITLPLSVTLLTVVTILVYLGLTERVLDRMRLDDKTALILLALLLAAHFLPPVGIGDSLAIQLGLLIPTGIVVYLFTTTSRLEKGRALLTTFVAGLILWSTDKFLSVDPGAPLDIDPIYVGGLIAGITAYVLGRSRRSAFIGGVFGILLVDLAAVIQNYIQGINAPAVLGGGGALDAVLINGVIAVGVAEFIGETRERIHLGPASQTGDKHDQDGDELD